MALQAIKHNEWSQGKGNAHLITTGSLYDDKDLKIETMLMFIAILFFLIRIFGASK